MPDPSRGTVQKNTRSPSPSATLARWTAGLVLLIAALACLVTPFMAVYQARQPFPGFMLEPTMTVSALHLPSWSGQALAKVYPLRILSADDLTVETPPELNTYLRTLPLGTPVQYEVQWSNGQRQLWPEPIPTGPLPSFDTVILFWIPYFVALAYLACGIWIYRARQDEPASRSCAILCSAVALVLCLFSDAFTGHYLTPLWWAALPLCAAAGLHMALVFPEALAKRARWLVWVPYALALGLILWQQIAEQIPAQPQAYYYAWRSAFLAVSAAILLFLARQFYSWRLSPNAHIRQHARSTVLGGALAFLPAAAALTGAALYFDVSNYLPFVIVALAIFPFQLTYTVVWRHLLYIDRVFSRGLVYSLLAVLLVGIYIALAGLIGWLAPGFLRADDPLTLALLVIVAVLLVSPLQQYLRLLVDRIFFRERVNFRRVVQEFGSSLAQVIDLPELSHLILRRITETLHLDSASLYIFDPSSGTYQLYEAVGGLQPQQAPVFAETDTFIQTLRASRGAVYRYHDKAAWLQGLPPEETARLNQLQSLVFLPLNIQNHLIGWLCLGAFLSGEGYGSEDLELLNALADRAAVAIENARLFAEHRRRLTELAVLNEIGQAINSARSLEQVLETIYQETGRLMNTTNFYIALYDAEELEVSFPLYVEEGERAYVPPRRQGNGLTEYLLRTQQPLLIAEDVESQVRSLGLDLFGTPSLSWLGVPILREDQAIGVIAVQSRQPSFGYDIEDLNILGAIANQAAIAIENARLYEMTDRALSQRLQEITVLAEFARVLATVALDPVQVAAQILQRAAETLQAGMGVLVHFEEATQSFAPLASLAWPDSEQWSAVWRDLLPDLLAAETESLLYREEDLSPDLWPVAPAPIQLLCPLIREDTLLAILHLALPAEVREPDSGRRRFLRHLADHAAVALENALLYQKQVEQSHALDRRARHLAEILGLSIAIRANMELDQVLHLVVETIRDTLGFQVAVISVVEGEKKRFLRRAAAVGVDPDTLKDLKAERVPLSLYEEMMRAEYRLGHSYMLRAEDATTLDRSSAAPHGLVLDLHPRPQWNDPCALLIPLRGTNDQLVGMLSVARPADGQIPDSDVIDILEILANQSAVVIENAWLYRALQEAYETKGEFLSLVAHELQVPMGTLWGYADLLDQESAHVDLGTLRGFVRVLKTNIGRLDALVRDLLEVSRIEAGTFRLNMDRLDAGEAVLESVATFRSQIERKGLNIVLEVPLGLPSVRADRDRLVQIFHNLVSNAYKYTPAPGVIAISAREIQQMSELDGSGPPQQAIKCPCILITVKDTGIGLSHQEQKMVFSRFFRGESTVVRQEEGTGLGLYLVRLLVESQGGQVWVESKVGQGSTFQLALPLAGE